MSDENKLFENPERGKYVSLLEDYPGFVKFASPITGAHYRAWRNAESEDADNQDEQMFKDWRKSLPLIEKWNIDGVPQSALTPDGDRVPLEVLQWVRLTSLVYLEESLNLKNLRAPSEPS